MEVYIISSIIILIILIYGYSKYLNNQVKCIEGYVISCGVKELSSIKNENDRVKLILSTCRVLDTTVIPKERNMLIKYVTLIQNYKINKETK